MSMPNIYLIKLPHYYHIHDWNLPLGLLYLGSFLKSKGLDPKFLDLSGRDENEWNIPLDGNFYCVSSNTPDFHLAVKIAAFLKDKTDATLVIGGIHPTACPEDTLKSSVFDIAAFGEGEHTLFEIVTGAPIEEINGICYRKNGELHKNPQRDMEKNLDVFPQPDLSFLDIEKYKNPIIIKDPASKGVPMIVSRGCPYECVFCASPAMWHRVTRFHGIDYVKENLDYYLSLGIRHIFFCDDTITINREFLKKICKELRERNIMWRCNSTTNVITQELTDMLYENGCRQIDFGVESGSDRILKIIKKSSTAAKHREAVLTARRSGLMTKCMLMVGHPFETDDDIMETVNFVRTTPSDLWGLSVFIPLPGCAVANQPHKFEFEIDETMGYDKYVIYGQDKNNPIVHKDKDRIEKYRQMVYEAIGQNTTLDVIKNRNDICCQS